MIYYINILCSIKEYLCIIMKYLVLPLILSFTSFHMTKLNSNNFRQGFNKSTAQLFHLDMSLSMHFNQCSL